MLFRTAEVLNESDYETAAKRYILRAYSSLVLGGEEFPRPTEDPWWWLQDQGAINFRVPIGFVPNYDPTATDQTSDSAPVFAIPEQVYSITGNIWYRPVDDERIPLRVDLAQPEVNSPLRGNTLVIQRRSVETYQRDLSLINGRYTDRLPTIYCEYTTKGLNRVIQFDSWGPFKGAPDYRANTLIYFSYVKRTVIPTVWDPDGEPIVPKEYRKVLADMAVALLFIDKDDDRIDAVISLVNNNFTSMMREHKRFRERSLGNNFGKVDVRVNQQIGINNRGTFLLDGYEGVALSRRFR